jgi:hypothetical protein
MRYTFLFIVISVFQIISELSIAFFSYSVFKNISETSMDKSIWFLAAYFLSSLLCLFLYLLLWISTRDMTFLKYGISVGVPFYNFIWNILLIFLLFLKLENKKYLKLNFNPIFIIEKKQKYVLSYAFIISFVVGITIYLIHYYVLNDIVWYTAIIFMFFFSITITLILLSFTMRIISLFKNKNFYEKKMPFWIEFFTHTYFFVSNCKAENTKQEIDKQA